jgi:hypothetical protein
MSTPERLDGRAENVVELFPLSGDGEDFDEPGIRRVPMPPWLAYWSSSFVEALASQLGADYERAYVRRLAEAVENDEPTPPSRAWTAFDRATMDVAAARRQQQRDGEGATG